MQMTHYMELLASNQPWNLLLFMAIPVILAETVAITELAILFRGHKNGMIGILNRFAGTVWGIYFLGVFLYLFSTAVIPLTMNHGWRGWWDMVAVGSYLLGVIPLMWMTLLDMNLIGRSGSEHDKLKMHATFVGIFLVVAHVAMIFGMLSPEVLWFQNKTQENTMQNMNM